MRALVVNCSGEYYNLGARKLADWLRGQGWLVQSSDGMTSKVHCGYDLVCLSVVFSWHAPLALHIARMVKANSDVWCGGPGMFELADWWRGRIGLEVTRGLDPRFERERGDYEMTFASRGCPGMGTVDRPKPCWFCRVWRYEGTQFTLDWDFRPSPVLCDNNLSALPIEFQEHIIRRYAETRTPLLDANSGFEPATFNEETYHRWKPVLRGPWRFGFDDQREGANVERVMAILKGERARRKRVYVLIGNEPIASCYDRAMKVILWDGEPFCQAVMSHTTLVKEPMIMHDWTYTKLVDFRRYFNRFIWRKTPIGEYSNRVGESPSFRGLL